MTPQATSFETVPPFDVARRYQDAYRVAKAVNGVGALCKTGGAAGGILIILATLTASSNFQPTGFGNQQVSTVFEVFGLIWGVLIMCAGWIIGVFISAHGQLLKATLDTAVYTSPFLSNAQKVTVMSANFTEKQPLYSSSR